MESVCELVYSDDEIRQLVQKQYPQAKITDASDDIHRERFQVDIEGIEPKAFYIFAIKEGFALECLGFQLRMRMEDKIQEVKAWIKEASGKCLLCDDSGEILQLPKRTLGYTIAIEGETIDEKLVPCPLGCKGK